MNIDVALSILAILMSSISLTWQVISWRRGGPVVKTSVAQSVAALGPGHVEQYTCVTARNTGRAPITVSGWGFKTPTGDNIIMFRNIPISSSLPHRLEAGSEASWFAETDDLRQTCAENGVRYQSLRAFVRLADGRTVTARRTGIGLA